MESLIKKIFLASYSGFSMKTWVTILATFVNALGNSVIIFVALYLATIRHFSVSDVAFIVSASGFGAIAGAFTGGLLCDKFDARKISIIMLIATGMSTCLIGFASQFISLIVLMLLNGFFFGAFRPANTLNLLQGCAATDRAKINGLSRVAVNLGMGVASVLGGLLVSVSYQSMFWFDSISSWLAAVILICFSRSINKVQEKKVYNLPLRNSYFVDGPIIFLGMLLLINCIVFFQSWTTYPLYLNKYYHFSASQFGYLFLLNCLMVAFLEVPLLNAVKNYNQTFIAAIGSLILCASFFILIFSAHAMVAVLSCLLLTTGEILLFSTVLVLMVDRANEQNKGVYVGFYQTMFSASNMLAPLVGSYIYTISPSLLWYVCGLMGVIGVLGFQFINVIFSKSDVKTILQNEM